MRREIDFRFYVLRNGAVFGELHTFPAADSPVLRMQDSAAIKMSLSGTFWPDVTDADGRTVAADWYADEIQPVLIIDGVEHSLGIFAAATVTPRITQTGRTLRIEAYDRCWRVRDVYTTTRKYFAAGTKYTTAIENLLTGVDLGYVITTPNSATLTEAREDWDIGTSVLTIVNELLGEINYNPLWFNEAGAAILEPASLPTAENIEHTLDGDNVRSLILPQLSQETDVYSAPNVFTCICSNPDKTEPWTKTAENNNPQSPLSIMRRGRRIMQVVHLNNIASEAELQAYADRLRNESMLGSETIRVSTGLLPGFGVADVVALHYGEINALCIERAYTMELCVGGTMQHILEKVVYSIG